MTAACDTAVSRAFTLLLASNPGREWLIGADRGVRVNSTSTVRSTKYQVGRSYDVSVARPPVPTEPLAIGQVAARILGQSYREYLMQTSTSTSNMYR